VVWSAATAILIGHRWPIKMAGAVASPAARAGPSTLGPTAEATNSWSAIANGRKELTWGRIVLGYRCILNFFVHSYGFHDLRHPRQADLDHVKCASTEPCTARATF
jgi:hypothetical protein